MQAPVTQLYENTWAIEDRGVRIFVLERVFPEKAVVRQMRRKNPLISPYGVRLSMEDFAEYESIHVYPVYAVSRLVRGQGRRIVFYLDYASFLETYGLQ